jgi:hypothetical protein
MSKRSESDTYNVSTYTDSELYDILDLSNPSDRELEAKIIFLYRKYKNMQNKSGDELANFFNDIYNHFFDSEEEDETITEGMTTLTEIEKKENITKPKLDISTDSRMFIYDKAVPDNEITGKAYYSTNNGNSFVLGNTIPQDLAKPKITENTTDKVNFVKQLDYATDNINPLLQQTVTRVISIDSQYRADKTTIPTEFTFDLSEPLKDVVSLSLYSVQIPYTWYTIAKSYGSNFFYIKGNSPGIDNGNHDIQISVSPGNYSPTDLVTAVNNSIKTNYSVYTDVSFASTNISYNPNTSLSTINVGIKNQYSENSYNLNFPYWTTPNLYDSTGNLDDIARANASIPAFLGLNYKSYSLNTVNTELFTTTDITSNDSYIYKIDPLSTTITIIKYTSIINSKNQAGFYIEGITPIEQTITISLSISTDGTPHSRNEILSNLNMQILNNINLSNESGITLITPSDNTNIAYPNSYYQLKIKPNRNTTNNITNSKLFLKFPDETNINSKNTPIWTGNNSCFRFSKISNELQLITGETPIVKQTNLYTIVPGPFINLKCINRNFTATTNNDITFSFKKTQPTDTYTVTELIDSINTGIIEETTRLPFLNGLPSLSYKYDNTSERPPGFTLAYLDTNNKFSLAIAVEKEFGPKNYSIDFTDSVFLDQFNLGKDINNNVLTNSVLTNITSTISILTQKVFTNDSTLFTINAIQDICGNELDNIGPIKYYTYSTNSSTTYYSYSSLSSGITSYLLNYKHTDGQQLFYPGTSFNVTPISSTNALVTVNLNILRKITAKDYDIHFIDTENSNRTNRTEVNFWSDPLKINTAFIRSPFNLYTANNSYITFYSGFNTITVKGDVLASATIKFANMPTGSNIFRFTAYEDGVFTDSGVNNIEIALDIYEADGIHEISYTRDLLISSINSKLAKNPLSNGTYLDLSNQDAYYNYYIIIRPNINKIYTANDYKIVFYDTVSYVKCFVGASGVQNTTWDSTLGWILGFRNSTYFILNKPDGTHLLAADNNNIITLISDTAVSTNLYNYFLICLDDFNLNHLNDGLITITGQDTSVPLPSYADRSNFQCDPVTKKLTYNANSTSATDKNSQLTQNQLYSLTQKVNAKNATTSNILGGQTATSYGRGPFSNDVFAMIPMKLAGLANGSYFVEYGGTLQNNNRHYFGPININRMKVRLISDKGNTVDLNGTNWSFSFLCQQLYKGKSKDSKK